MLEVNARQAVGLLLVPSLKALTEVDVRVVGKVDASAVWRAVMRVPTVNAPIPVVVSTVLAVVAACRWLSSRDLICAKRPTVAVGAWTTLPRHINHYASASS